MTSDAPARLLLLDALWQRGFPAAMTTPAGLLPAVVVWVETPEHPALAWLRRAFGGHLVLEMRSHHGEESPAFWVGVGRSAALALGVVRRALEEGREAGRPRVAALLGGAAEAAWREADDLAALRMRGGSGAPLPPEAEVARRAEALEARVAAAFTLAPHISGGLNTALASALRAAPHAVDLALPSRPERDAWAAAFLAPLLRHDGEA